MSDVPALLVNRLILAAAWQTIWVAIVAQLLAIGLGILLGLAQLSGNRVLRSFAWTYNWFFQGTPLLMQLIFFWAVLPLLGLRLEVIVAGILGLALNEAARMGQIIRGAVMGIDPRLYEAARNLGMSQWQLLRHVTAPLAFRIALPSTGNEFNYQFKATSLLAAISIVELTRTTLNFVDRDPANPIPYFAVAALYYLAMSTAWGWLQERLEAGAAKRGFVEAR